MFLARAASTETPGLRRRLREQPPLAAPIQTTRTVGRRHGLLNAGRRLHVLRVHVNIGTHTLRRGAESRWECGREPRSHRTRRAAAVSCASSMGIAAKLALPVAVRDHRHARRAGPIVLRARTSGRWSCRRRRRAEVVAGDDLHPTSAARDRHKCATAAEHRRVADDILDTLDAGAIVVEIGQRAGREGGTVRTRS